MNANRPLIWTLVIASTFSFAGKYAAAGTSGSIPTLTEVTFNEADKEVVLDGPRLNLPRNPGWGATHTIRAALQNPNQPVFGLLLRKTKDGWKPLNQVPRPLSYAEIYAGYLKYVFTSDENTAVGSKYDSFRLLWSKGKVRKAATTVNLEIRLVNNSPTAPRVHEVSVKENERLVFHAYNPDNPQAPYNLNIRDSDNFPFEVGVSVYNPNQPVHGVLLFNGKPLDKQKPFTLEDLILGRLSYQYSGLEGRDFPEVYDSFMLQVTDGQYTILTVVNITIEIQQ